MSRPDVKARAAAFVAKARPSVSGSNGHDALYAVACALVVGFGGPGGLSENDVWSLIGDYNAKSCNPPWSDKDLARKIDQARKVGERNPSKVGELITQDAKGYTGPSTPSPARKPIPTQPAPKPAARGAPNAPPRDARTPRTPLFDVKRFGEGGLPRTARTVRTFAVPSFALPVSPTSTLESKKEPSGKSDSQKPAATTVAPSTSTRPAQAPMPARPAMRPVNRGKRDEVTTVWEDGTVERDGKPLGNVKDKPKGYVEQ